MKKAMPLNYEKLSPKGKFIRTCICVPILFILLFGSLWFCATHFTLGAGFIIKASIGVVLLVWYYIAWYRAERPKAGTLEWIDRYERPRFALSACGKALRRTDALWALLPFAVAAITVMVLHEH